jgi:hypothetical protein
MITGSPAGNGFLMAQAPRIFFLLFSLLSFFLLGFSVDFIFIKNENR